MIDAGFGYACNAVRFFAMSAEEQIAVVAHQGPAPAQFERKDSNIVFAIACVFVTYNGSLLNELDETEMDVVEDFAFRLNVAMMDRRQEA